MALEDAVTSKKRTGNPRPVRRIRISPGAVLLTGAAIIGAVYLISQAVKADTAPLQNTPEQPGQVQLYTTPTVEPTATVMPTATAISELLPTLTPIPTQTPTPIPTPVPTSTPTPSPTPTPTPALEDLLLIPIRQHIPEYAGLISQQEWFKDGLGPDEIFFLRTVGINVSFHAEHFTQLKKYPCVYKLLVEEPVWFSGSNFKKMDIDFSRWLDALRMIALNISAENIPGYAALNPPGTEYACKAKKIDIAGSQKNITLFYDKNINTSITATIYQKSGESHKEETVTMDVLDWIVKSLRDQYDFLGGEPSFWSSLFVLVTPKAGGAFRAGDIGVAIAGINSPLMFSHEVAHAAAGADIGVMWYNEGLATILEKAPFGTLGIGAQHDLRDWFARPANLRPLDNYNYHWVDREVYNVYAGGAIFLLDYRNLAGHTAFQATVKEAAEVFRSWYAMNSTELKEIFIKNAPEQVRGQVEKMYDAVVFGE